jgi:uncharacterized damage-inducible protein DinB
MASFVNKKREKIMTEPALTAHELIDWVEKTSTGWRNLLASHPELLALPCDVNNVQSVAQLLQHIVAVELRFAERLSDLPATDYTKIPYHSVEEIYATHDHAFALVQKLLASEMDWEQPIEFSTRVMGPARSTPKTILFHLLLHSIRHYAQLATLARQQGIKPDWGMDYLLMNLEAV